MWTISELKERGKIGFKANYWKCVLVGVILGVVAASGGGAAGSSNMVRQNSGNRIGETGGNFTSAFFVFLAAIMGIALIVAIVSVLIRLLILAPLEVGCKYFFSENTQTIGDLRCLGAAFDNGNYWTVVKTMFLKGLFQVLWTLLFIIPGIIKSYEYSMIPYLLADEPDMSSEEIFAVSRELMDGNKMHAFLLDLSFIGWKILGAMTCGLVWVFYGKPYEEATDAELYQELRQEKGI